MKQQAFEDFRALCTKWERNKHALGFSACAEKDGMKLRIQVLNSPPDYADSVDALAKQIASKAIQYISSTLIFPFDPKDRNEQIKFLQGKLHGIVSPLVNYLFEFGFEAFDLQVRNYRSLMQMRYELEKLQFQDGNWIRWTNEIWNGRSWKKGESEHEDNIARALSEFMESQFQVV